MPNTHIVLKRLSVGNGKYLETGSRVDASGYRMLDVLEAGPDAYLRRIQDAEAEKQQRAPRTAGTRKRKSRQPATPGRRKR